MPSTDRQPVRSRQPLSRRRFAHLGSIATALATTALVGCGRKPNRLQPPPEEEPPTDRAAPGGTSAPTGTP